MPSPFETEIEQIIHSEHSDPFHVLGSHPIQIQSGSGNAETGIAVRAFLPEAQQAWVIPGDHPEQAITMESLHPDGFFQAVFKDHQELFPYELRVATFEGRTSQFVDPYVLPPLLTDFDLYLIGEGSHYQKYEKLGAHRRTIKDVEGLQFAVWAPNAKRVSVIGDFNRWDGRRHPMRVRGGT